MTQKIHFLFYLVIVFSVVKSISAIAETRPFFSPVPSAGPESVGEAPARVQRALRDTPVRLPGPLGETPISGLAGTGDLGRTNADLGRRTGRVLADAPETPETNRTREASP